MFRFRTGIGDIDESGVENENEKSKIRKGTGIEMNKKRGIMLAAVLLAGALTGCGGAEDKPQNETVQTDIVQKETAEHEAAQNEAAQGAIDTAKYVTLGDYKGLQVTAAPVTVDEAQVEELMHSAYDSKVTAEHGITDKKVEEGDTVNIDYEGKKDGVAFEGGTAKNSLLVIGSGNFIEGFEEGLIGVTPGETMDLNLTFPENYRAEELAGQDVVFTVTVNFILPGEMKDEVVPSIGIENVNTVEELHQHAYDYLYEQAKANYDMSLQGLVMEAFMKSCEFNEIPKEMIEEYEARARKNIEAQAKSLGVDAETFTSYLYQMDLETFVKTYSEEAVKQDIAIQAVAAQEKLGVSDEELDAALLEQANNAGFETMEEYLGENSKEDYRAYLLFEKVLQYLMDNATITE